MNNTKFNCSLNDTTNLRKLILENPDLPLLIFCGDDAWHDEWPYEQAAASGGEVKELTLYKDLWVDKDDYRDRLTDDLCDEAEFIDLSNEEYDRMIDKKVRETEFVRAIVIYVG